MRKRLYDWLAVKVYFLNARGAQKLTICSGSLNVERPKLKAVKDA